MLQLNWIMQLLFIIPLILFNFHIAHSFPFSLHEFNIDSYRYVSIENNFDYGVSNNNYLLPDTITPKEYNLKIIPNFNDKSFVFSGQVIITLQVNKDTNNIILNSVDLSFNKTTVKIQRINDTGTVLGNITVKNVEKGNISEQVIISTEGQLKANSKYALTIDYGGFLLEGMSGFYRSWYINNGAIRWIGTTQMEAPYARSVFPSFDEPRFKTPFTIQIARNTNVKTVSNMPIDQTSDADPSIGNRVWDIYKKSPSMSTYLVAFCVFDFQSVKNEDVTVWMQPDAADQADYILTKVKGILNILSNFTAIDYSIKKMELVAVPDFSAGAMENWGLTTYREKYLLYKPNISTATDMQNVLSVVAHEMSHQWFGNLVTPVWWDYLWLNEAFATFFEFYIPSIMEPSWRMMEQFVVRELQYALSEDDGGGHPLNANVTTSAESEAIFDVYEYSKGGSIVRMMQHFTGENNFKTGIQEYLRNGVDQSEGVVTPQNLWNAFNKTLPSKVLPDGVRIYDIMTTWTEQRGFPLITVTRNYANKTLSISQKEFLKADNLENSTLQWWVPLTYTDSKKVDFSVYKTDLWLRPNEVKQIKLETDDWVLFNIQQIGYYRVNYDTRNWNLLIDQLIKNHTVIHPINRAQIIDDSFALAEAGLISYDIPFRVSQYLSLEKDYIPWFSAAKAFHYLINKFYFTSTGSLLKEFVRNLVRPIYNSITEMKSEQMTHVDKLTTGYILSFACNINLNDCEKNLVSTFNNWNSKISSFNLVPETKEAVLCTGVKLGNEQSWNNVWTYYNNSKISSEKFLILRSMGCSTNSAVLTKYLSMLKETKEPPLDIRKQDYRFVFSSVASRPVNTGIALKFLTENYKVLQNVTKAVKSMFGYLGSVIVKQEDYNTFQQFYDNNKGNLGELNSTVYNALSDIKEQINWIKKYNSSIEKSLFSQSTTTSFPETTKILTTLPSNFTNTTVPPTKSSGNFNQFCLYLTILIIMLTSSNIV